MYRKSAKVNCLLLILLTFLTAGCGQQYAPTEGELCDFTKRACVTLNKGDAFSLSIDPGNVPLEQELNVQFNFPEDYKLLSAHIQGINMFMGKIPVIVEAQRPGYASAVTFLGSCSEPKMQWHLLATFSYRENGQPKTLMRSFRFKTDNNG